MKNIYSIFITIVLFANIFAISSCKKEETKPAIQTGTLTDIDGNVYKTVKIGNKWWMTENLKTTRYRNGDSIVFVGEQNNKLDSAIWNNTDSGAYCILDNSSTTSQNYQGKMFGFLYNGFVVEDARNIAPAGWHIPTDAEWKELETALGMASADLDKMSWRGNNEGNKLKIQTGWNMPSDKFAVWGSNDSGFGATGSGCCLFNGIYGNPNTFSTGFWWSSTSHDNQLWYRHLDYNKSNVFRYYGSKNYGFSIRCVKD